MEKTMCVAKALYDMYYTQNGVITDKSKQPVISTIRVVD